MQLCSDFKSTLYTQAVLSENIGKICSIFLRVFGEWNIIPGYHIHCL